MKLFTLAACLILASCAQQSRSTLELASEKDLSGHRVATVTGSYYAMKLSERDDIELMLFTFEADALQALLSGKADVMVQDEVLLNREMREEYGIKVAFKGEDGFPTALMFRKDAADLVGTMNTVQERMIREGKMDSLKNYWLGDGIRSRRKRKASRCGWHA